MESGEKLYTAILGLTVSMDALRAELRTGREKQAKQRKTRTLKKAERHAEAPVSELAQAAARRAVKRLGL